MLTAKTEETDKIVGLSVGADDYMTKPFSPRELTARVKAAMRRLYLSDPKQSTNSLTFKDLEIDLASRKVLVEGYEVELTAMEFDLLAAMAEYPGMVLSREQLLEIVWGQDYYGELRVVDVHIGHIRHKLGDYRFISTVRGVGYRFEGEEEEDSGDS
jgi:two-component system, OmpR family, alkaline phosphatase synthesis response regulator PhoP